MRLPATRWLAAAAVTLVALAVAFVWDAPARLARQARASYDTAGLEVERAGWDTLRARPRFVRRTSLGPPREVRPETTFVHVFGARYDTLYAGPATGAIPLPDRRLASREPLLVEACGRFARQQARTPQTLCEQTTIFASPKRVRAEATDIAFPEATDDFQRGRYDVRLVAERQAFGDTVWTPLEQTATDRPRGYLVARSESRGGQGAVRVPMSEEGQGTFDLSRHAGYEDFRYHLRSSMKRAGEGEEGLRRAAGSLVASVDFEVLAGWGGAPPHPVSRTRKEVRRDAPREHRRQVQLLAQRAAAEIARRVMPGAGQDARADVQDWRYDRSAGRYEIDLRASWSAAAGDPGERYVLEGTLAVADGSREARFTGDRGNRRAARHWRRQADGNALPLGPLQVPAREASLPAEEQPEGEMRP